MSKVVFPLKDWEKGQNEFSFDKKCIKTKLLRSNLSSDHKRIRQTRHRRHTVLVGFNTCSAEHDVIPFDRRWILTGRVSKRLNVSYGSP